MFEFKTLLVEKGIYCPYCNKELNNGDIMLEDTYRGEIICGYCKEEYKNAVILEEGENGELLK